MTVWSRVRVLHVVLASALVVWPSAAVAQDNVSEQIWLDYNPRWTKPSGLEYYGDAAVRTEFGPTGWGRFILRPGVRGPVGPFTLMANVGGFYTANVDAADRMEVRGTQGAGATWPNKRFHINHLFRVEERFEWEFGSGDLAASLRLRYRLQTGWRWGVIRGGGSWRVLLHTEAFLTVLGNAGEFDEKFRAGVGLERTFNPKWRARVDITWQKVGAFIAGAPTDEIYVRVRVFQFWSR